MATYRPTLRAISIDLYVDTDIDQVITRGPSVTELLPFQIHVTVEKGRGQGAARSGGRLYTQTTGVGGIEPRTF